MELGGLEFAPCLEYDGSVFVDCSGWPTEGFVVRPIILLTRDAAELQGDKVKSPKLQSGQHAPVEPLPDNSVHSCAKCQSPAKNACKGCKAAQVPSASSSKREARRGHRRSNTTWPQNFTEGLALRLRPQKFRLRMQFETPQANYERNSEVVQYRRFKATIDAWRSSGLQISTLSIKSQEIYC